MWPSERVNNLSRNIPIWRTVSLCGVVEQLPHQLINIDWGSVNLEGWLIQYWFKQILDMCVVLSLVSRGGKGLPKGSKLPSVSYCYLWQALFKRRAKWPLRNSLVQVILTFVRCSPGDSANGTNIAVTIESGSRLTCRWSLPPSPLQPPPFFSNRREIHSRSQGSQPARVFNIDARERLVIDARERLVLRENLVTFDIAVRPRTPRIKIGPIISTLICAILPQGRHRYITKKSSRHIIWRRINEPVRGTVTRQAPRFGNTDGTGVRQCPLHCFPSWNIAGGRARFPSQALIIWNRNGDPGSSKSEI